MSKLYKIAEQHKALSALVESEELTAEMVADTFEGIEGEFAAKADSLIRVVNDVNGDINLIDAEIKRLQARKKAMQNQQKSLRDYLKVNMQQTGIKQIKCPLFTITLADGRDVAVVDDADQLPDDLVDAKVEIKPNKSEILKRLKAGQDVPGARIDKTEQSIRIR